jgi:hypothetical protein
MCLYVLPSEGRAVDEEAEDDERADEELISAVRSLDRAAARLAMGKCDPATARHLELAHHHATEARRRLCERGRVAA